MAHARGRTWTLAKLNRDVIYRMWFNEEAFRWEADPMGRMSDVVQVPDDAADAQDGTAPAGTDVAPAHRSDPGPARQRAFRVVSPR